MNVNAPGAALLQTADASSCWLGKVRKIFTDLTLFSVTVMKTGSYSPLFPQNEPFSEPDSFYLYQSAVGDARRLRERRQFTIAKESGEWQLSTVTMKNCNVVRNTLHKTLYYSLKDVTVCQKISRYFTGRLWSWKKPVPLNIWALQTFSQIFGCLSPPPTALCLFSLEKQD